MRIHELLEDKVTNKKSKNKNKGSAFSKGFQKGKDTVNKVAQPIAHGLQKISSFVQKQNKLPK